MIPSIKNFIKKQIKHHTKLLTKGPSYLQLQKPRLSPRMLRRKRMKSNSEGLGANLLDEPISVWQSKNLKIVVHLNHLEQREPKVFITMMMLNTL